MVLDVVAGAVFILVIGVLIRAATRPRPPVAVDPPAPPVTLLGVVPPPRSEMVIDSCRIET